MQQGPSLDPSREVLWVDAEDHEGQAHQHALGEHDAPKIGRRMTHDDGSDVQPGILGTGARPILADSFVLQGIRRLRSSSQELRCIKSY